MDKRFKKFAKDGLGWSFEMTFRVFCNFLTIEMSKTGHCDASGFAFLRTALHNRMDIEDR